MLFWSLKMSEWDQQEAEDRPWVPQCVNCGKDMEMTHADERFCCQECADHWMNHPTWSAAPLWAAWRNRLCVCGKTFNARYVDQKSCCPEHEGLIPCSKCGTLFKFNGDGRVTKCAACRLAPTARQREPMPCRGCGTMFTPPDGRTTYCPVCSEKPYWQRRVQTAKALIRRCLTCLKPFEVVHGTTQVHCCQECAWPAAWSPNP
jgi:hypothetical protein